MICDRWDIVVVPFPFVDRPDAKSRPALVLSDRSFNQANHHTIMAMITTGAGASWPSDVRLSTRMGTGLKSPSLIRAKLFTLDNRLIRKKIGALPQQDISAVQSNFAAILP